MVYLIPGAGEINIQTIILDLNGTLTVAGRIAEGTLDRLTRLKGKGFKLVLLTGNTRNDADKIATEMGIDWKLAANAIEKRDIALTMDPDTCASIGNGLIDLELMKVVKLRIVTLQSEGVNVKTLLNSDVIIPTFNDALDLFLDEQRLIATLRS